MEYKFEKLTSASADIINKYAALRPILTSEGQFLNQFIWAGFYDTEYYVDETCLFFKMKISNEIATMMPLCKEEDIVSSFFKVKDYFNQVLKKPMKMYIVDELFLKTLQTSERFLAEFDVTEERDCFDYIYDADKLKTLSGRAYHKKKNHLNQFLKEYAGRYEYRTLTCSDLEEMKVFHKQWMEARNVTERLDSIAGEEDGIRRIFEHCNDLNCKMGGVYIDGKLSAFSVGSYTPHLNCAFIHIEKGAVDIRGIYNYINQQFLLHEFPEATLVNREDDLGQEGLRKAKLSYRPIKLEAKFNLIQKEEVL